MLEGSRDFANRTFPDSTREHAGLGIYDERFQLSGDSKANLLLSESGRRWNDGKLSWGVGGKWFESFRPDQRIYGSPGFGPESLFRFGVDFPPNLCPPANGFAGTERNSRRGRMSSSRIFLEISGQVWSLVNRCALRRGRPIVEVMHCHF